MRPRYEKEFTGSTGILILLLLLGIVLGLIYYFVKREKVRHCGKCGSEMREGDTECPSCGAEVD